MTDKIDEKLTELIEEVHASALYTHYQECRLNLEADPEAAEKVRTFRQETVAFADSGSTDLKAYADGFCAQYEELRKIPVCAAFLDAEEALSRVLRAIENTFFDAMELSVPGDGGER